MFLGGGGGGGYRLKGQILDNINDRTDGGEQEKRAGWLLNDCARRADEGLLTRMNKTFHDIKRPKRSYQVKPAIQRPRNIGTP